MSAISNVTVLSHRKKNLSAFTKTRHYYRHRNLYENTAFLPEWYIYLKRINATDSSDRDITVRWYKRVCATRTDRERNRGNTRLETIFPIANLYKTLKTIVQPWKWRSAYGAPIIFANFCRRFRRPRRATRCRALNHTHRLFSRSLSRTRCSPGEFHTSRRRRWACAPAIRFFFRKAYRYKRIVHLPWYNAVWKYKAVLHIEASLIINKW